MCLSATASFGTAALLMVSGAWAVQQGWRLGAGYRMLALTPAIFAVQQFCEGMVWLRHDAGPTEAALPFALGFHFFSHFLWLWWFPLAAALIETVTARRRLFMGVGVLGALTGGAVYLALLLHPEWLKVSVRHHSIVYDIIAPVHGSIDIPLPASAVYAAIVLLPLLLTADRLLRRFGLLIGLSMVLASALYGYAFVSVWCFFAAALSLYLVHMVRVKARVGGAGATV